MKYYFYNLMFTYIIICKWTWSETKQKYGTFKNQHNLLNIDPTQK